MLQCSCKSGISINCSYFKPMIAYISTGIYSILISDMVINSHISYIYICVCVCVCVSVCVLTICTEMYTWLNSLYYMTTVGQWLVLILVIQLSLQHLYRITHWNKRSYVMVTTESIMFDITSVFEL